MIATRDWCHIASGIFLLTSAASMYAANQRAVTFGTTLPATCFTGDLYFKTNASSGANIFACVSPNTWVTQAIPTLGGDVSGLAGSLTVTQIQGHAIAPTTPQTGQSLTWNSSTNRWEPQTATGPATTLGGDVVGPSGANTVTQIQGHPVVSTAPVAGQALVWNGTTTRWEPQTLGVTGASMASQLGDLTVTLSSSTVLTIGPNCSFTTPCNVRFGAFIYSFTSPFTATLAGGTGNAYFYISSSGTLTVGHNLAVTCSGACIAPTNVSSFPTDSIPLFLWHATNGAWDAKGSDQRAFLSVKDVIPGPGMMTTESLGHTTIGADPSVIGLRANVPATSASSCTSGAWALDVNYYYLCVTQNTWRRAALSSW